MINFNGYKCELHEGRYANGERALLLRDADGLPVATATVCIPYAELYFDEVLIKDWSENAGMIEALQTAGIIGEVRREVPAGYVTAKAVRYLKGEA